MRYGLADGGGRAWYGLNRTQQRNAVANYAVVLGLPEADPAVRRVARRAFQNYGRMLADFALAGALTPEELLERVELRGLENVDRVLARGKGCIFAACHMGSWDWGGSAGGAAGYPMSGIVERFPGSLDEAVAETRQRFGMEAIPLDRGAIRKVTERLEANRVVTLICDLQHGPGPEVSFFGRAAIVPGGPASFAYKTGAGVLPAHVWMKGPGRYVAEVGEELPLPETGDRKQDHRQLMQSIVGRFETYIRRRPDQWFAFRPMFGRPLEPG